ncbi:hypothetical protein N7470_004256 [Penicillium chermesinum]|nr:hypothetical protein N7470_004256 [Penicillium chermesinum]
MENYVDCGATLPSPVPLPRLPIVEETLSRPSSPLDDAGGSNMWESPSPILARDNLPSKMISLINTSILDMAEGLSIDFGLETPPLTPQRDLALDILKDQAKYCKEKRSRHELNVFRGDSMKDETNDHMTPISNHFVSNGSNLGTRSKERNPDLGPYYEPLQLLSPPLTITPEAPKKTVKDTDMNDRLVPSPLRIRKKAGKIAIDESTPPMEVSHDENTLMTPRSSSRFRPPRLPLRVMSASEANRGLSSDQNSLMSDSALSTAIELSAALSPLSIKGRLSSRGSVKKPAVQNVTSQISPADAARIVRSNQGIAFLRETVFQCVADIQLYVEGVKQLQRQRQHRHDLFNAAPRSGISMAFLRVLTRKSEAQSRSTH